jgi:hypothetical protein
VLVVADMSAAPSRQLRPSGKDHRISPEKRERNIYYPNVSYGMRPLRGVDQPQMDTANPE